MKLATRWMIGCITLAIVSVIFAIFASAAGDTVDSTICCFMGGIALIGCYYTPRETKADR